jgi:hypothetical protein
MKWQHNRRYTRSRPERKAYIREYMSSDAEGRNALREATAQYSMIAEAGHAPRSSEAICREVMKDIRKKKKTAVEFAPCLDTKDTPGSLPEEQTREPLFIWETMEPDERRKFLMAYFVSKLKLKEWIEETFAEKLVVMQQCWAIEAMPSEIETQE